MASIINATTTNGVAISADNSGILQLATNSGTTAVTIDASQNVGIGISVPSTKLDVVGTIWARGAVSAGAVAILSADAVTGANGIALQASFAAGGYGPIGFYTSGVAQVAVPALGGLVVVQPAGLGYGTGSGGTVTQATSKSTAVTLNKPTGQITMNNAALAAGAIVTFVVTNSLVAQTDTVVLTATYIGINPSNYRIECMYVGTTGQFGVRVTNISAGSLSEALQINYAIIKGATA